MGRPKKSNIQEQRCKEFAKEDEIKKEIRKYNALYKDVDKNIKKTFQSLVQNAAFMAITLRELQDKLNKDGLVCEYQNGENQWGTKKSPEVDIYNTMVKNYISCIKQLADFLPKDEGKKLVNDGFDEFVSGRDD